MHSITAALAGALTGYNATEDDLKRWESGKEVSHPYLVYFYIYSGTRVN